MSADTPPNNDSRRRFLKASAGTMAALAATGGVLEPLRALEGGIGLDEFLQQHYQRLSPETLEQVMARLEDATGKKHGVQVKVNAPQPMDGVEFGYALNLTRCNGSRKCVSASVKENNQSRDPAIEYIRVLEMPGHSFDVEKSDHYYDHETVPAKDKYYLPVQCHQCGKAATATTKAVKAPCTKVCPVRATWTEDDGITVVDYNWCIGCRYCMAACPYEARRFNWDEPKIPAEEINPNQGYLSNRIRPKGVVEKCHFCLHRTREGRYPACMEACPTGARVFGNMLDTEGELNYILRNKRVYILKEDAGTFPRFFYYFEQ